MSDKEGFSEKQTGHRRLLPTESLDQGNYIIEKILGEGGFGVTYMARDTELLSTVAIKEYYMKNPEDDCEKFLREAQMLSSLSKIEGIVKVRRFFRENGTAYIVMDYVDGISIREYVRRNGKISPKKVLEMMRKPIIALHMVHECGLIHRDISADNIMVSSNAKLTLIDFGAARYFNAIDTDGGKVVYKPGFSALEQYNNNGRQGTWTDVYEICATMYFMMTGEIPVQATDRLSKDSLVPLHDKDGVDVSDDISRAVSSGMEINHEDRIQNMEQLYELLYKEDFPKVPENFFEGISAKRIDENNVSASTKSKTIKSHILSVTHLKRELDGLEAARMRDKKKFVAKAITAVIILISVILGIVLKEPWQKSAGSGKMTNPNNNLITDKTTLTSPKMTGEVSSTPTGKTMGNTSSTPTGKAAGNALSSPTGKTAGNAPSKPTGKTAGNAPSSPTGKTAGNAPSKPTPKPTVKKTPKPKKRNSGSKTKDGMIPLPEGSDSKAKDGMIPLPEDSAGLAGSLDDID